MSVNGELTAWVASTGAGITIALDEPHSANAVYIARVQDLGLKAEGKTLGEAIVNLFANLETYVATHQAEESSTRAAHPQMKPEDEGASRPDG
jgi:hypothetical protein